MPGRFSLSHASNSVVSGNLRDVKGFQRHAVVPAVVRSLDYEVTMAWSAVCYHSLHYQYCRLCSADVPLITHNRTTTLKPLPAC